MNWIDQDNDPAPQWVGNMAVAEMQLWIGGYLPETYLAQSASFKALCRRIYRTETPPVDPDFERMKRAIAAYEVSSSKHVTAELVMKGHFDNHIEAALDAWNETVAS